MQKHEREALAAIEEIARPHGLEVTLERAMRGCKLVAVLHGPKGTRKTKISSSPKNPVDTVNFSRQWARRMVGELT